MSTKIVIDKEQKNGIINKMLQKIIDTLPVKPVFEGDVLIALHDELLDVLTENSTEIQIDQSIEERAETILKEHTGCEGVYLRKGEHFGETVIEAMVELATSQQIIEQEMEEFNLFVSANFMYSFEEKKWYHNNFAKHNSVHYEKHYTFTELLTKFKNR
mgnify:CR=1 FL=1